MIQRLGVVLLTIVAMVLGANIVCLAQPQSLLTRHVSEVTLNGQAPFVGRFPQHNRCGSTLFWRCAIGRFGTFLARTL